VQTIYWQDDFYLVPTATNVNIEAKEIEENVQLRKFSRAGGSTFNLASVWYEIKGLPQMATLQVPNRSFLL
jgi:hypothetical protein